MTTSKYPGAIDDYGSIRIVTDRISAINAADHNEMRSAVLAIENTLGVNPQGAFGTVTARLNDAYGNIEAHVLGSPPRHQDNVIMSPDRTGSLPSSLETPPYSLSSSALADQISNILDYLNDSLMYDGSGSTTFADGYALPLSLVRSTITQIVNQLGGGTAGTTKVSGATITGSNFTISAGTLRSQLVALLNLIDAFGGSSGAGSLGANPFTTSDGSRYNFTGTNAQVQLNEAGNFLDDNASLQEKLFNAFVIEGMEVSGSGDTATIADGYVMANGRLLSYSGGSVSVPDGVTSYVYVQASSGVVTVSINTAIPTRPINPIILLNKIVRAGASWTTDIDLRRFGLFANDKNYISVGRAPTFGKDGYGADFTSLKSAVEYAKTVNSGGDLLPPLKIILSGDLYIEYSSEMEIDLDIGGIEIDGCGRTITTTIDAPLFNIDADNITIRDVVFESELSLSGTSSCLALVGNSSSVSNLIVTNCKQTKSGSIAHPYFLRLGNSGATTSISEANISNNSIEVELGGVEYVSTNSYAQVLNDSIVSNNHIYQGTFSTVSGAGIKASQNCSISDNIIKGGFGNGIFLAYPKQSCVDGNVIMGFQSATIYMDTGIAVYNSADNQDNGSIISNNIVKGIDSFGINCRPGSGGGEFISVFNNLIDNFTDVGSPPSTMIGIRGTRSEDTWVVGNNITAPGDHAIEASMYVINNKIYGEATLTSVTSAIEMTTNSGGVVLGNVVYAVDGISIDGVSASNALISNNILIGDSPNSTIAIDNVGSESIVSGNLINDYSANTIASSGNEITVSGNRIIECSGYAVELNDSSGCVITNNWFECPALGGFVAIYGIGSDSIVSDNYIIGYGMISNTIELYNAANSNIVISGNFIEDTNPLAANVIYVPSAWSGINITGNIITGVIGIGIDFLNAQEVVCSDNIIICSASSSIAIKDIGSNSIVSGNYIFEPGTVAIDLPNDNCIISNNLISGPGTYGIDIAGDFSVADSNIIAGSSSDSINIQNTATNNIISSNMIYNSRAKGIAIDTDSDYHIISNNYIYTPSDQGIESFGDFCIVNNNFITNAGVHGILTSGTYNLISCNIIDTTTSNGIRCHTVGDKSMISDNIIYNTTEDAIHASDCGYISISNNSIKTSSEIGILVEDGSFTNIVGNIVESTTLEGIKVDSTSCNISHNIINQPTPYGIYMNLSHNSRVIGNSILSSSGVGILTTGGDYLDISNNLIYDTGGQGIIILTSAAGSIISGNNLRDIGSIREVGISMTSVGALGAIIDGNYIETCSDGILCRSDDLVVSSNVVKDYSSYAIDMLNVADAVIVGNKCFGPDSGTSNVDGLYLNGASHPVVVGNYIEAKGTGDAFIGGSNTLKIANKAYGGAVPTGFSSGPASDIDHSWHHT